LGKDFASNFYRTARRQFAARVCQINFSPRRLAIVFRLDLHMLFTAARPAQIFLVAHIELERNLFRITLLAPGAASIFPTVARTLQFFLRPDSRRARKRVVPQIHRHGSGVAGRLPRNSTAQPALSRDGVTTPTGKLFFSSTGLARYGLPRNR